MCPSPRDRVPSLTGNWMREYEEIVRTLTLREEVADGRPRSTGPERPAELKAGFSAGLSANLIRPHHSRVWEPHTTTRPIERQEADTIRDTPRCRSAFHVEQPRSFQHRAGLSGTT